MSTVHQDELPEPADIALAEVEVPHQKLGQRVLKQTIQWGKNAKELGHNQKEAHEPGAARALKRKAKKMPKPGSQEQNRGQEQEQGQKEEMGSQQQHEYKPKEDQEPDDDKTKPLKKLEVRSG